MAETGDWSQYRITRAGRELRQYCLAHGIKLVFTKAAIGEGIPDKPTDVDTMADLVSYAADAIIKKSYAIEENHLHIVRVDNSGYKQDVLMTEVSVWARREDQEDSEAIQYGYAYNMDGYVKVPRQTNVTNRKIYEITLDTALSATTEIQIIYDESSLWVSHADLDDVLGSWFATKHIATIEHQLEGVPICTLYRTEDALGTLPFGEGPYGGGGRMDTPYRFRILPGRQIEVYATPEFAAMGTPTIIWSSKYSCNLVFEGSRVNLTVEMRD